MEVQSVVTFTCIFVCLQLPSSQLSQPDHSGNLVASLASSGGNVTNTVSVSTTSTPLLLHTTQPQSGKEKKGIDIDCV